MTDVVVSGAGAVTAAGLGVEPLWQAVLAGRSLVQRIDRFDPSRYRCQVAAQADGFDAAGWLPGRLVKRTDRFTHLALVAAQAAMDDAGLRIGAGGVPADRVGVMVGNVLGGWAFAERELRTLWTNGPRAVSPYQATAWFPAAPQGNICIRHGIKGRARTFVCERASGAYAIAHAADTIRRGLADVVVAGGTEQPLSPYAWLCCETGAFLTPFGNADPQRAYRPFDQRHGGTVIGEGSAFVVLESAEHAAARGATPLGTLAAWALTTDGYMPYYTSEPYGQTLARTVRQAVDAAGLAPAELGCVVADGSGVPREDASEVAALRAVVGAATPVTAVKPVVSHLMGAATVVDLIVALRMLSTGRVPAVTNLDRPAAGFDLDFVTGEPRTVEHLSSVALIARGMGGVNACLVLTS